MLDGLARTLDGMALRSGRHLAVLGELTEWWEDLWQRGQTQRITGDLSGNTHGPARM